MDHKTFLRLAATLPADAGELAARVADEAAGLIADAAAALARGDHAAAGRLMTEAGRRHCLSAVVFYVLHHARRSTLCN